MDMLKLKYIGAAQLTVEFYNSLQHTRQCAGEEMGDETERMVMFAEDFNRNMTTLEMRKCGSKFGIFGKESKDTEE